MLDTIETLFSGFTDPALVRAEIRRLFGWLKDCSLTAIITGERGAGTLLTRNGLEEYIADCVIVLDNRVQDQISTQRLRVLKYRGSAPGADEYPFLIDEAGSAFYRQPRSALLGRYRTKIISTGIPGLDFIFQKRGLYRGSSILLSGDAGAGKTTMSSHFIDAAHSHIHRPIGAWGGCRG